MAEYRIKHEWPIGGLVAVGFAHHERYLLLVTHSGRGVFDLASGEQVAREYTVVYPHRGVIEGIGPLQGEQVHVVEYDFQHELIVESEGGRYRAVGSSSSLAVAEAS